MPIIKKSANQLLKFLEGSALVGLSHEISEAVPRPCQGVNYAQTYIIHD